MFLAQGVADARRRIENRFISGTPDGARLWRLYHDLGTAALLLDSPMAEVPEEERPVAGVDAWVGGLLREATAIT